MTTFKRLSLLSILLLLSFLATQISSMESEALEFEEETDDEAPSTFPVDMENLPTDQIEDTEETRNLASYPSLRIHSDVEHITKGTGSTTLKNYLKNELIPSVTNYFQAALKVKHPLTSKISSTAKTICGLDTPAALKSGVNADFFLIFYTKESSSSWLAITTACALGSSGGIKKPLIVKIGINSRLVDAGSFKDDPLTHDLNINTLLHEMLHALAVRSSLYKYFLDSNGKLLKNHVKSLAIAGETREVLDLAPLTSRLRTFYDCAKIPGLAMENDGGAHFERRYFQGEVMSSGGQIESKMSEFSLAFLEGTGWYVPDYTYAEPYYFGKGAGCGFIYDNCNAEKLEDFCQEEDEKGCGYGTGGGSGGKCISQDRAEGCKYYLTQRYFNCEHPGGASYTTFADKQVYGRGMGSKCFSGNITQTSKTVKQNTYCFTYKCLDGGKTLRVNFGSGTFDCKKKGPTTLSGYKGFMNCPDPETFCSTIGKPTCPRNCMGQGKCVDGTCKCNSGYQGTDCAFRK